MRAPKWDWKSHEAKMKELYDLRVSIPDIHEAIQCEGFRPCLSSVYSKFRSLKLPTDPAIRTQLLDKIAPHSSNSQAGELMHGIEFNELVNNQSQNRCGNESSPVSENPTFKQPIAAVIHGCDADGSVLGRPCQYLDPDEELRDERTEREDHSRDRSIYSTEFQPSQFEMHSGTPHCSQNNSTGCKSWDFNQGFEFQPWPAKLTGTTCFEQSSSPFNMDASHTGSPQEFSLAMELQFDTGLCLSRSPEHSSPNHMAKFFKHQNNQHFLPKHGSKSPFGNLTSSNTARSSNRIQKFRSLFRPKSGGSSHGRIGYADSQLTTQTGDSGYASGYTSNISFEDIPNANPRSLDEFNGLYRTACCTLHEPHSKAKWKDIPTCSYCRYSSVHNLAWSARYLKLEVFSLELQLTEIYDLGALDAAGNTALHYAAASGAGFRHLKALINAGVNPSIANTAGELFIYCLRPLLPFSLEPNSDCFDDLINLLELLQPQLSFDWRDNSGQTIMHALALKVTEPQLKAELFKFFDDAGYPATIIDRYGRTALDVLPLTYGSHGQVIEPQFFTSLQYTVESVKKVQVPTACNGAILSELPLHHVKQIQAHTIIAKSHQQARYIDPETGDNVVHALSQLKSEHDILENLECFVQKDVDLNLHNREGQPPLISFICNRSSEEYETGATMSKYLDAIIWKNIKDRLRNNINIDMKDRKGATALHYAAIRGRPDSTRSLIEAGANVNARLDNGLSILHATFNAFHAASLRGDDVQVHLLKEVISHLEHAGAVQNPTSLQERGIKTL